MDSKILVVDDNPVNRKLLTTILNREGYRSIEAENGDDALSLAHSENPDVILLDIMMPGKDGFSVCQELRQDPDFEDTPVLFLSALSEVKERIKGFDVGANDYITKPYHQAEVLARVKRSLSFRRKSQRQKERLLTSEISERGFRQNHEAAAQQQRALLPGKAAAADVFESAWWQHNPGGTSGEMFNLGRLDDRHYAAFLFDAGGQGLSAAAISLALSKLLSVKPGGLLRPKNADGAGYRVAAPDEVLAALDKIVGLQGIDTFFSMQYLLLDAKTGVLRYANVGGKPFPLLLRANGASSWLEGSRPPLESKAEDFFQGEVRLKKGDRLFLMSDGVTLTGHGHGKPFGDGRVDALAVATQAKPLAESVKALEASVNAYGDADGESRSLLGLEFKGVTGPQ
jgi:sigma-B regulation protein RsbU (phosphoserine phosphatase)